MQKNGSAAAAPGLVPAWAGVRDARPACAESRQCPISGTPCPGECVFAYVMHGANLGIVLLDGEARAVIFENEEARRLLAGLSDSGFDDIRRLLVADQSLEDVPESGETMPPLENGGRLVGYSIYRNGRFVWALLRDITEKARLEAVAEAVELANNTGYVFAAVRHELGNPANSLKMTLSVLRRNLQRFDEATVLDYVDRSLHEIDRVNDLLLSLKSYSMYERVNPVEAALEPFLTEFAHHVDESMRKKGIRVQTSFELEDVRARFDPRALRQVLLNLVSNAADALEGRPGGRLVFRAFQSGDRARVEVEDTGRGMSEEQLSRLFRPFSTTKAAGTGLGLVITKRMLASMGGTIEIRSEEGSGTVAGLTLPLAPPARA